MSSRSDDERAPRVLPLEPLTLVVEASTTAGSVALLLGADILACRAVEMGPSREDSLFPAVTALLDATPAGVTLDAIVCGAGPGSFTSLRIAAAVGKGIAHAVGAGLYAVPSLLLAAAACDRAGRYLVHAEALRGERYTLEVEIDAFLLVRAVGEVRRIPLDDLMTAAQGRALLSVGAVPDSLPGGSVVPDASRLGRVAGWATFGAVELASWEPAYGRLAEAQVKWEATHARALPGS